MTLAQTGRSLPIMVDNGNVKDIGF